MVLTVRTQTDPPRGLCRHDAEVSSHSLAVRESLCPKPNSVGMCKPALATANPFLHNVPLSFVSGGALNTTAGDAWRHTVTTNERFQNIYPPLLPFDASTPLMSLSQQLQHEESAQASSLQQQQADGAPQQEEEGRPHVLWPLQHNHSMVALLQAPQEHEGLDDADLAEEEHEEEGGDASPAVQPSVLALLVSAQELHAMQHGRLGVPHGHAHHHGAQQAAWRHAQTPSQPQAEAEGEGGSASGQCSSGAAAAAGMAGESRSVRQRAARCVVRRPQPASVLKLAGSTREGVVYGFWASCPYG